MKISISHPTASELEGFRFFWAKTVTGFVQAKHCLASLTGPRHAKFKPGMPVGATQIATVSGEEVYLCGVAEASPGQWGTLGLNFHLVARADPKAPPFELRTYNGYTVKVEGGVLIPITPLPSGWNGLAPAYTRCRNFQYGVQRFGYVGGSPASQLKLGV